MILHDPNTHPEWIKAGASPREAFPTLLITGFSYQSGSGARGLKALSTKWALQVSLPWTLTCLHMAWHMPSQAMTHIPSHAMTQCFHMPWHTCLHMPWHTCLHMPWHTCLHLSWHTCLHMAMNNTNLQEKIEPVVSPLCLWPPHFQLQPTMSQTHWQWLILSSYNVHQGLPGLR